MECTEGPPRLHGLKPQARSAEHTASSSAASSRSTGSNQIHLQDFVRGTSVVTKVRSMNLVLLQMQLGLISNPDRRMAEINRQIEALQKYSFDHFRIQLLWNALLQHFADRRESDRRAAFRSLGLMTHHYARLFGLRSQFVHVLQFGELAIRELQGFAHVGQLTLQTQPRHDHVQESPQEWVRACERASADLIQSRGIHFAKSFISLRLWALRAITRDGTRLDPHARQASDALARLGLLSSCQPWVPGVFLDAAAVFLTNAAASFSDETMNQIFLAVCAIASRAARTGDSEASAGACDLIGLASGIGLVAMRPFCIELAIEALCVAARRSSKAAWLGFGRMLQLLQVVPTLSGEAGGGAGRGGAGGGARSVLPSEHEHSNEAQAWANEQHETLASDTPRCIALQTMLVSSVRGKRTEISQETRTEVLNWTSPNLNPLDRPGTDRETQSRRGRRVGVTEQCGAIFLLASWARGAGSAGARGHGAGDGAGDGTGAGAQRLNAEVIKSSSSPRRRDPASSQLPSIPLLSVLDASHAALGRHQPAVALEVARAVAMLLETRPKLFGGPEWSSLLRLLQGLRQWCLGIRAGKEVGRPKRLAAGARAATSAGAGVGNESRQSTGNQKAPPAKQDKQSDGSHRQPSSASGPRGGVGIGAEPVTSVKPAREQQRRTRESDDGRSGQKPREQRQKLARAVVKLVLHTCAAVRHGHFRGDPEQLESVIDTYRDAGPDGVAVLLVQLGCARASPWKAGWMRTAQLLVNRYYVREPRSKVRLELLRRLSDLWEQWKCLHAAEAADSVLLPVLAHVPYDRSSSARAEGLCLLTRVAAHCSTMPGIAASETLDVVVYLALADSTRSTSRSADLDAQIESKFDGGTMKAASLLWSAGSAYAAQVPGLLSSSRIGQLVCGGRSDQWDAASLGSLVKDAVASLRPACVMPMQQDHCSLVASMCLGWIAGQATSVVPSTLACRLLSALAAVLGRQAHGDVRVLALRGLRRISADEDGHLTMISPSTGTLVISAVRATRFDEAAQADVLHGGTDPLPESGEEALEAGGAICVHGELPGQKGSSRGHAESSSSSPPLSRRRRSSHRSTSSAIPAHVQISMQVRRSSSHSVESVESPLGSGAGIGSDVDSLSEPRRHKSPSSPAAGAGVGQATSQLVFEAYNNQGKQHHGVVGNSAVFPVAGGIRQSAREMVDEAASDTRSLRRSSSELEPTSLGTDLDLAPMWEVVEGYLQLFQRESNPWVTSAAIHALRGLCASGTGLVDVDVTEAVRLVGAAIEAGAVAQSICAIGRAAQVSPTGSENQLHLDLDSDRVAYGSQLQSQQHASGTPPRLGARVALPSIHEDKEAPGSASGSSDGGLIAGRSSEDQAQAPGSDDEDTPTVQHQPKSPRLRSRHLLGLGLSAQPSSGLYGTDAAVQHPATVSEDGASVVSVHLAPDSSPEALSRIGKNSEGMQARTVGELSNDPASQEAEMQMALQHLRDSQAPASPRNRSSTLVPRSNRRRGMGPITARAQLARTRPRLGSTAQQRTQSGAIVSPSHHAGGRAMAIKEEDRSRSLRVRALSAGDTTRSKAAAVAASRRLGLRRSPSSKDLELHASRQAFDSAPVSAGGSTGSASTSVRSLAASDDGTGSQGGGAVGVHLSRRRFVSADSSSIEVEDGAGARRNPPLWREAAETDRHVVSGNTDFTTQMHSVGLRGTGRQLDEEDVSLEASLVPLRSRWRFQMSSTIPCGAFDHISSGLEVAVSLACSNPMRGTYSGPARAIESALGAVSSKLDGLAIASLTTEWMPSRPHIISSLALVHNCRRGLEAACALSLSSEGGLEIREQGMRGFSRLAQAAVSLQQNAMQSPHPRRWSILLLGITARCIGAAVDALEDVRSLGSKQQRGGSARRVIHLADSVVANSLRIVAALGHGFACRSIESNPGKGIEYASVSPMQQPQSAKTRFGLEPGRISAVDRGSGAEVRTFLWTIASQCVAASEIRVELRQVPTLGVGGGGGVSRDDYVPPRLEQENGTASATADLRAGCIDTVSIVQAMVLACEQISVRNSRGHHRADSSWEAVVPPRMWSGFQSFDDSTFDGKVASGRSVFMAWRGSGVSLASGAIDILGTAGTLVWDLLGGVAIRIDRPAQVMHLSTAEQRKAALAATQVCSAAYSKAMPPGMPHPTKLSALCASTGSDRIGVMGQSVDRVRVSDVDSSSVSRPSSTAVDPSLLYAWSDRRGGTNLSQMQIRIPLVAKVDMPGSQMTVRTRDETRTARSHDAVPGSPGHIASYLGVARQQQHPFRGGAGESDESESVASTGDRMDLRSRSGRYPDGQLMRSRGEDDDDVRGGGGGGARGGIGWDEDGDDWLARAPQAQTLQVVSEATRTNAHTLLPYEPARTPEGGGGMRSLGRSHSRATSVLTDDSDARTDIGALIDDAHSTAASSHQHDATVTRARRDAEAESIRTMMVSAEFDSRLAEDLLPGRGYARQFVHHQGGNAVANVPYRPSPRIQLRQLQLHGQDLTAVDSPAAQSDSAFYRHTRGDDGDLSARSDLEHPQADNGSEAETSSRSIAGGTARTRRTSELESGSGSESESDQESLMRSAAGSGQVESWRAGPAHLDLGQDQDQGQGQNPDHGRHLEGGKAQSAIEAGVSVQLVATQDCMSSSAMPSGSMPQEKQGPSPVAGTSASATDPIALALAAQPRLGGDFDTKAVKHVLAGRPKPRASSSQVRLGGPERVRLEVDATAEKGSVAVAPATQACTSPSHMKEVMTHDVHVRAIENPTPALRRALRGLDRTRAAATVTVGLLVASDTMWKHNGRSTVTGAFGAQAVLTNTLMPGWSDAIVGHRGLGVATRPSERAFSAGLQPNCGFDVLSWSSAPVAADGASSGLTQMVIHVGPWIARAKMKKAATPGPGISPPSAKDRRSSTLDPTRAAVQDVQRHVGNDNVCIVLLDGPDAAFPSDALASAVTRVFVLVQPIRGLLGRVPGDTSTENEEMREEDGPGKGHTGHTGSRSEGSSNPTGIQAPYASPGVASGSNFEVFRVTVVTRTDLAPFGPIGSGGGLPQPMQRMVLEGMPPAMHRCLALHAAPPGYTVSDSASRNAEAEHRRTESAAGSVIGAGVGLGDGTDNGSLPQIGSGPRSVPLGLGRLAASGQLIGHPSMLVRRRRLGPLLRRVALEADLACRCADGDNSRVPAFPPAERLAALHKVRDIVGSGSGSGSGS